ncbi:M23 family metallopeptidase [Arcobacter porcinus]|uniref:Zinc metallopeptidase, M23 family n=1 Tax=Arcobacter porcinus TaxID=1935204 RepID=A0A5C2HEH0_9BACT|nr:M23 family metallopeptidase [Arcobacter porcinus]OCL82151.1 Murein DD-endopeptidase MepM [Arcobacter porcinus]OCL84928.1 Murein DD-endopeptidase MepM [Arcobacter porcinus]OCL86467.1 Murein DD-endopeptidase MepM [Aliarcobacter thereius]QEP40785.1 zinc metallopeptidase, M23 family [Arcobacter porcinus]
MEKVKKSYFNITIHHERGMYQLRVPQKPFLYTIVSIFSIFLISLTTAFILNFTLNKTDNEKINIEYELAEIQRLNEDLNALIGQTQLELNEKNEEITEASKYLSKIENLIGISTTEENNNSLKERVNIAKLDSDQRATLLQLVPNGFPVEFNGVTSPYGYRQHPILDKKLLHMGVDLRAPIGTEVYATADGVVHHSAYDKFNGNLVVVQHIYGFKTYYAHLNKAVVKSGDFVKKGDLIAYTGNTGRSSGPHLHYEVRFLTRTLDPMTFARWDIKNYTEIFEKENEISWHSLITAISNLRVQEPTPQLQLSLQELK